MHRVLCICDQDTKSEEVALPQYLNRTVLTQILLRNVHINSYGQKYKHVQMQLYSFFKTSARKKSNINVSRFIFISLKTGLRAVV